jgi:hypothetical protein
MKLANPISAAALVLALLASARWAGLVHAQDPSSSKAQSAPKPYVNHEALFPRFIETKDLQGEMPLAKFLQLLEKQLPKEEKISVRIDREAFGDAFAHVAATPVRLPEGPKSMRLSEALKLAIAKIKIKSDYRLGTSEILITTRPRALYTAIHDLRGIKPQWVIEYLASLTDQDLQSIRILNGNRLVVRANEANHSQIAYWLLMWDVRVIAQARLYEVDEAYYTKLKNIKPLPLEEEERIFRNGGPGTSPWGPLFNLLKKQKRILVGDEINVLDGQKAVLLSRHRVGTCLPSPAQVRKGEKERQTVLLGVSFSGHMKVSPDRRYVQVRVTESVRELQGIDKRKVSAPGAKDKEVDAEIPLVSETTHIRVETIADGGTALVPVPIRPRSELPKDRWWVLAITPRIWIAAEEQLIEKGTLADILPAVVDDVLKNPRLKATREFYGSPGDKRYALVNSPAWNWTKDRQTMTPIPRPDEQESKPAWTWTKDGQPVIPGFQLTPSQRTGKRLLGIRIDKYQPENNGDYAAYAITVTLVNAGGSDNGPVIGGGTIRYIARSGEKGWRVELAE